MTINHRALFVSTMVLLLFAMACSAALKETGVLEGHVTIGPLEPVAQEGVPEPTPAPEVFALRKIVVLRERDGKEVAELEIDREGYYWGELPAGTYVVDINYLGIDFAKGFPMTVEIKPDQVTRLDVDIDTGIR